MVISRMDLADAGSPEALVDLILRYEPGLAPPIPIEDLARQLDIRGIEPLTTTGFDGGLLTDGDRSEGIILVNEGMRATRRRFTIGHELGHFLMPSHVPDQAGRFLCSQQDIGRLTTKEQGRRARMEVEANRFSSLLLIPPALLQRFLAKKPNPEIAHIPELAKRYRVSKEAMARAYVTNHDEAVAVVMIQDGKVRYSHRDPARFPYIHVRPNAAVPGQSHFHDRSHRTHDASQLVEVLPDVWLDPRGQDGELWEQIYLQENGFAQILLHWVPTGSGDEKLDDEE